MSKDNVMVDELPDQVSLVANWETRISLLEHDVSVLQGRVPKSKIRGTFWLLFSSPYLRRLQFYVRASGHKANVSAPPGIESECCWDALGSFLRCQLMRKS